MCPGFIVIFFIFLQFKLGSTQNNFDLGPYYDKQKKRFISDKWEYYVPGRILDQEHQTIIRAQFVDESLDLVQPNELHFPDVPKFSNQPKGHYYVLQTHPATFRCRAYPVDHMVIVCLDDKFPVDKPNSKVNIKRTKYNETGQVDDQYGQDWLIEMNITSRMLHRALEISQTNFLECHCEAWNKIQALKRAKKIRSETSVIEEAYMRENFRQEPTSNNNVEEGKPIQLQCEPPESKPKAEIHWFKDGKPVTKNNFPRIHIDTYKHLIIPQASKQDSGNYTCVASLLDIETRQTTALIRINNQYQLRDPVERIDSGELKTNCKNENDCFYTEPSRLSPYPPKVSEDFKRYKSNEFNPRQEEETPKTSSVHLKDIFIYVGLFLALTTLLVFVIIALMIAGRKQQSRLNHNNYGSNIHHGRNSLFGLPDKDALKYKEQMNQNLMIVSNPLNVNEMMTSSPNNGASNSSTNSSGAMLLPNQNAHYSNMQTESPCLLPDAPPNMGRLPPSHVLLPNGIIAPISNSSNFASQPMTPMMNQFITTTANNPSSYVHSFAQNGLLVACQPMTQSQIGSPGMSMIGGMKPVNHMFQQTTNSNGSGGSISANDGAICSVPPLESYMEGNQASSTVVSSSVSSTQGLYNEIPLNGAIQTSPRGKFNDQISPKTVVALTLPDSGVYDSVLDGCCDNTQQKSQSIYYNYSLIEPINVTGINHCNR